MSDRPFSRRDFLKTAALAGAVAAVPPKLTSFLNESGEGEDFGRFGRIETENAYFYPFFERHDKTPNLADLIKKLSPKPRVHFLELLCTTSAAEFQKDDPLRYLFTEVLSDTSANAKVFGRNISDETLDFFSYQNIPVAYEGIVLPDKFMRFDEYTKNTEAMVALGVGVAAIKKIATDSVGDDPKEKVGNTLLGLGATLNAIWSLAPSLTTIAAGNLELLPETKQLNYVKDALWNVNRHIRNLHPEQMTVFFRNLVMARKLQTLAKYYSPKEEAKPGVSFSAGFAHEGIKDLLILGESVTLAGFNLYPKDILREIVDANGGIEAFSSTLLVSVRETFAGGRNSKTLVLDTDLKNYLETRLE